MNDNTQKIIGEYSEEYCRLLEDAYGDGMMSEGGTEAIDRMFLAENLQNKTLLDVGFGLGGAEIYLAEKHQATIFGVEINPWLVEEAARRTPLSLQKSVKFLQYDPDKKLPFPDDFFDIVFSKGVLTHLNDKKSLFNEIKRILKPGGAFIIDDWLSPEKNYWGERLNIMCEKENLTLYAETESNYIDLLNTCGFLNIETRDENDNYYRYNMAIISRLRKKINNSVANKKLIKESIKGYQLIADSIKDHELLIRWIKGVACK